MPAATRPKQTQDPPSTDNAVGDKHELEEKPAPESKKQKTIEETLPSTDGANGKQDSAKDKHEKSENGKKQEKTGDLEMDNEETKETQAEEETPEANTNPKPDSNNSDNAVEEGERDSVPSSILEKGIIYFFFRGRVNTDEPTSVDDIQRSYMILRPISNDAKLGDAGNTRLIAVPKKVWPTSGKERWIAFVEKKDASFKTLREEFLKGEEYMTKTMGARHTPAAQPAAEGVYAITTTKRESHLAYMITLPREVGELQSELGLRQQGSFILSTRNPEFDAPRGTALPEGPDYSKEVQNSFRSLRWQPTVPEHLDYVNSQFLLIGESNGIENALEQDEDGKEDERPKEELEKLEDEDMHRMEDLKGDDSAAIFADLGARADTYPKLETTF